MLNRKTIQSIRVLALCVLVVFCFGATGEICGFFFKTRETAFGSRFPDNQQKDIRAILSRIGSADLTRNKPENRMGRPIAVLVVKDNPRAIVGIDLEDGKKLWRLEVSINSDISLGGDLMVFKSGKSIVAYNISNGKKLWDYDLKEGWEYYGCDVNGDLAAITIGVGGNEAGGYANGQIVVLKANNGFPVWEHGAGSGLLGKPVVVDDLVFVPWDRQRIVIVDVNKGREVCRIRAEDYAINFVERGSGGVYFGSQSTKNTLSSIVRFNEDVATGTREGSTVFVPDLKPVPGVAHFERDGFSQGVGGRNTEEKIRFHWQPAEAAESKISMEGGQFYLHYWRYVIAFDAVTSKVTWTYQSKVNIESVAVLTGGYVICADTEGRLFVLDTKTGKEAWQFDAGEEVLAAFFDANGFTPAVISDKPEDPAIGIKRLILDKDNRMLPIRAYATYLLAAMPSPAITRDLLDIYSDPFSPKALRDAVVEAVETRTAGGEYMMEALNLRYDFIEKTQPPPMKIVAPALINMNEKEAIPGLLRHLMDHETPIENLVYILAAIHKLGDESVVETLKKFITLYHADIAFLGNEQVIASAAHTLMKYSDKESSQAFVAGIRDDMQTLGALKIQLREVLDPALVAKEKADKKAKEEADRKAKEEAEKKAKEAAFVPDSLTQEEIHKTIADNQELLKPCILEGARKTPTLQSVRMRFLLTGATGIASEVRVLPSNVPGLVECLEKAFGLVQFKKFKKTRQMATYTISIESGKTKEAAADKK